MQSVSIPEGMDEPTDDQFRRRVMRLDVGEFANAIAVDLAIGKSSISSRFESWSREALRCLVARW